MKKLLPADIKEIATLLKQGKVHEAFILLAKGNKLDDNFKSSHEKNDKLKNK